MHHLSAQRVNGRWGFAVVTINAFKAFNMVQLGMHRVAGSFPEVTFYDNDPYVVNGVSYQDTVQFTNSIGGQAVELSGNFLVYGQYIGLYGGTVTGLFLADTFGGTAYTLMVQGISLSGSAAASAIRSSSSYDDYNLLAGELWGADTFVLSQSSDYAEGLGGNDTMFGRGGSDTLLGGAGRDAIFGGGGSDNLVGGTLGDRLNGGLGNDTFAFGSPADGGDVIADFHRIAGDNDRILLEYDMFRGASFGQLASWRFQTSTTNVARNDDVRAIFRTTDKTLWWDANGNDAGGLSLIADLQASAVVRYDDIFLA